jgi:NAD(P)-dependent dehydrogenase (short-subunit alcohol dehydrogenase family)
MGEFDGKAGGSAIANKASVADRAGAKSIIQDAVDAYGTVDTLVNNAGILRDKSFKNMTLDEWDLVMNVLAIEGQSHNIHVNCLAPAAATRMTASIPGRPAIDVDNPPAQSAPSLVTPAVIYMASEAAPRGKIFQAAGGRFSMAAMYSNAGVNLASDASFEAFLKNEAAIQDMSAAVEGRARRVPKE